MMNSREIGCQHREHPVQFGHPAMLSDNVAERMVNIAGLEYGDTVVCMGDTGPAIEAAAAKKGARTLCSSAADSGSKCNTSPFLRHTRFDTVLWAADLSRHTALTESLSTLCTHLRPGGRLVLWAPLCSCRNAQASSESIQRLLAGTDFTSVIVGNLSADAGEMTIATGILGKHLKEKRERKVTRGYFSGQF